MEVCDDSGKTHPADRGKLHIGQSGPGPLGPSLLALVHGLRGGEPAAVVRHEMVPDGGYFEEDSIIIDGSTECYISLEFNDIQEKII